ncbi:C40 family peptidase [Shewanella avicenniae]|uniref:C40 family peptidase n=1 Tax=Shewanella avicenniae TaxID=2814294 RepID=A0ABX7QRN1_9GAMM|nr:NlpC/P60 family protein [Shewanella avicenniae]QSX33596.1 C40 family peptidase [Shewanella avicenniae]
MGRRIWGLLLSCCLLGLTGCSSKPEPVAVASTQAAPSPVAVQALAAIEQQWRGVPYRFGGSSKRGIDCSAFVQLTYQQLANISLPRTTEAQATQGQAVPLSQLLSGDLVFFKTGWRSRHVGIYLSNNNFMHASTSEGVTVSSLNSPYWRDTFWQARRIVTKTP